MPQVSGQPSFEELLRLVAAGRFDVEEITGGPATDDSFWALEPGDDKPAVGDMSW